MLVNWGHNVCRPKLSNLCFNWAVKKAELKYSQFKPDIIVGSSRGGAVAMNINSGDTPLILLAPAYKRFGHVRSISKRCFIIHGVHDILISPQDSIELRNPSVIVDIVDDTHRLTGLSGLAALYYYVESFKF